MRSLSLGGPDYWNVAFGTTGYSTWVMFFQGIYRTTMNPNVGYYVYYINAVTVQITNDYAQVYNPITFGLGVSFVAQCGGYSPTLG